jgi:predicted small secreted protein
MAMHGLDNKLTTVRLAAGLLFLALAAGMLSACNTVAGAGKDISGTGNAVTGTSEQTKQALPPAPSP